MSILSQLARTYGKRPLWLVEIIRGADVYRYNLGVEDATYGGETYAASPLWFDELVYSSEIRKDDFTLHGFPLSDADTQALLVTTQEPTTLTLRRGFVGDGEVIIALTARLSAVRFARKSVSFVFSSWADDRSKRNPGFPLQRHCPWMLYGNECGLNRGAWLVDGTASAYVGQRVTVGIANASPDGTYTGGWLRYAGQWRSITRHSSNLLTLVEDFPDLRAKIEADGTADVDIAPGCDKSRETCLSRFDNIPRHGGFPQMTGNPFQKRMI